MATSPYYKMEDDFGKGDAAIACSQVTGQNIALANLSSASTASNPQMAQSNNFAGINLDQIKPVVSQQPQVFSPFSLDPGSLQLYNGLTNKHMSGTELLNSLRLTGCQLHSTVSEQFVSLQGGMGYSDLLAGLLYRGENLIQYGQFGFLQYSYLQLCDENNATVSTRNSGVCLLTDKRILFMSSQVSQSTSLKEWGNPKALPGGYTLTSNLGDATAYLPIPLRFFRSVEMKGQSGVRGEVQITGEEPCCGGLCGWCGELKQWRSGTTYVTQNSEMSLNLGVLMPPWERRMYLHIRVLPNTPIVIIRDFIAALQQHATGLN